MTFSFKKPKTVEETPNNTVLPKKTPEETILKYERNYKKSLFISVRVPENLHNRIASLHVNTGIPKASIVRNLIIEGLKSYKNR